MYLYLPPNQLVKCMGIKRYKPTDYAGIVSWYKARGLSAPPKDSLSTMGFVADNRVAGWLYLTNSNVALIEGVISNPYTVPSLRRASLQKLAGVMVDSALSLGYTTIKVDTNHPSIQKIVTDMGFKEHSLKTFILHDDDESDKKLDNHSVYTNLFFDNEEEDT